MKKTFVTVMFVSLLPVLGQAQAPAGDQKIDYKARLQSVVNIKENIARREARFEAVRQDLRTLDARVEEQISSIVKTLSSMVDSQDSRTRVANIKEDVMKSLIRTMGVYRQKRMAVYERMRKNPETPKEQSDLELKIFDERIGKRIGQVMEIARSFPGHVDIAKYESDGDSYWRGWSGDQTRISEEWKQNRRDANSGKVARRDLLQQIEKSIVANQSRRAAIADNLTRQKLDEREYTVQQEELGRMDAILDLLQTQRRELALPTVGAARALGLDEAQDAEEMLDDTRADLANDFASIMRKFSELDAEGLKIHAMKENLKAREEWLKNNAPPAP
ncbi:MAG: hypothetical protein RLZZ282_398 [Verrucomicrobiota bacterium]|jgi:hypothetical protein